MRQRLLRREERPAPAWMQSPASASPRSAARLGVLLSLANPEILLYCAAAGMTIGVATAAPAGAVLAVVLFAVGVLVLTKGIGGL